MKHFLHCISLLVFCATANFAQQIPVFNQNIFENLQHNPAVFGAADGGVRLAHRRQFLGLETADAPVTYLAQADISRPLGLAARRIGLGILVSQDKAHISQRTGAGLAFSYHLMQNDWLDLALGIGAGMNSMGLNTTGRRINDISDATLYNGEKAKGGQFHAGPGLFFKFRNNRSQTLQLNLAVPQLFGNNPEFDEINNEFVPTGHFLGSVSYKIPIGQRVSVEPAFMVRSAFADKNRTGQYDIAARIHFMNGRFWAGGGTRFANAPGSLHGGFGLRPVPQFSISADYENHAQLGGSFEVLIGYHFSDGKKTPDKMAPPTVLGQPGNVEKNTKAQLKDLENGLKSRAATIAPLNSQAATQRTTLGNQFIKIGTKLDESTAASTPQELRAQSEIARANLEAARDNLASLNSTNDRAQGLWAESRKMTGNLFPPGTDLPMRTGLRMNAIEAAAKNIQSATATARAEFDEAQKKVDALEKRAAESWDFTKLIASGNLEAAAMTVQNELDTLRRRPSGLAPVKLVKAGDFTVVTFQFPDVGESYDFQKDLRETAYLLSYIAKKARLWQSKGMTVGAITVRADLAAAAPALREMTGVIYEGNKTEMKFSLLDKEKPGAAAVPRSNSAQPGKLDLEQLVALKATGMAKVMEQSGTGGILPTVELVVGNGDQYFNQIYSVSIRVR